MSLGTSTNWKLSEKLLFVFGLSQYYVLKRFASANENFSEDWKYVEVFCRLLKVLMLKATYSFCTKISASTIFCVHSYDVSKHGISVQSILFYVFFTQ